VAVPPTTTIKVVSVCSASIGHVRSMQHKDETNTILQAPPLYNAGGKSLLWIVSNIYHKTIDCLLEMVIEAANNLQNFASFAYDLLPFEQESVANLHYRVIMHFLESREMQSRPRRHSVPIRCYHEQSQWKYKENNICCGQLQLRQLFCRCQGLWV